MLDANCLSPPHSRDYPMSAIPIEVERQKMVSTIVRASLWIALCHSTRVNTASKRSFFVGASAKEEAREAAKWQKNITYVGIAACSILAFGNLSKGHPYFEEPPPYPYLYIL